MTFKIQRSCIKMLSIMWLRFINVAVTELSSVETMLITVTAGEKEIVLKYVRYADYCRNLQFSGFAAQYS